METKHKSIVSVVQYVCDNCKMAALIYLRPHVDGFKPKKVYGCPRCSASIVTEKDYPHYIYDKDQSKVDPLTDLEIVELRGILERDHLAVKALVEGYPVEIDAMTQMENDTAEARQASINQGKIFTTVTHHGITRPIALQPLPEGIDATTPINDGVTNYDSIAETIQQAVPKAAKRKTKSK